MMSRILLWGILAVAAATLLMTPLRAQTGSIAGTVEDASGAVIPNVAVTTTNTETGVIRRVTADTAGHYHFPFLPVGGYTIDFEAAGFRKYTRTGFTINVGAQATLDVVLEIGAVAETVAVTGEAPLLNTRSSEVTALIDPVRMTELPLNGRNPIELAGLLPGVSGVEAPEYTIGKDDGPRISIAGSRGNHNAMLFDGARHSSGFRNVAMMYPTPDSLREFKVVRNLFSAEYGSSGGGVLNAVTRSGTNAFHGNFYEFLRNDNLNARNSFLPRKTNLIQNQFGLSSGGRIVRNKLFYFGYLEFLRIRPEASTVSAFPPTAAERAGDFSGSPRAITDPLSGRPFPGNQIPVSRYDTVSRALLDRYLPLPNQPDGRLISSAASPVDGHQFTIKLDYQPNSRHTFSNRFYRSDTMLQEPISPSNIPGYGPGEQSLGLPYNNVFSWVAVVSNRMVNEFRTSLFYLDARTTNYNRTTFTDLGGVFPHLPDTPMMPSSFQVSGRVTLRPKNEDSVIEENYEILENLSWEKSNHSLKIGGRWFHGFYQNRIYSTKDGSFTFDQTITGNALADFLLGKPRSMSIISPDYSRDTPGDQFAAYIQDDWRVTPRLTLNLGLRYEFQVPWIEERGFWSTLFKNSGFQSRRFPGAPVDMAFHGDPGVPDGMVDLDRNNFQPRIGFAYSPGRLRNTVLRGGFGMFNERNNVDIIQNTGQPFQFNQTFFSIEQLSDPLRGLGNLPLARETTNPVFRGPFSMNYPDRGNSRNGYILHYNLMVQREFGGNLSIELGYVGKQSRKLSRSVAANPAVFVPGQSTSANIESRRIFRPGIYSSLTESSNSANGNYNSLQVEVIRRLARGFSIQGAYTLAKSIDDVSGLTLGGTTPNPFDWTSARGVSDFDQLHNANVSFVFELPKWGQAPYHKILLNDWELSGVFTARSGAPFSVFSGRDIALSGTGNQTADAVGNPEREHASKADAIQQWFNTSAFAAPETGRFGNTARNVVRGPGMWDLNLGVFRNIPVTERYRVQFRSEFFNLLNHTNLGTPNSTMNNVAFGRILSGGGSRVIQFALKISY
jgi:outer membrane receptor protein involved in Fe transport